MNEVWTVKKILDWTVDYFTQKQVAEPRLSAEWLLAEVLNCRRIDLYLQFERILTAQERDLYREYVKRRANREPVQYILGETEFYGLPFKVTPSVLIPRPDTEILVDKVVEYLQTIPSSGSLNLLDIGTGSGCIAIALAKHFPTLNIIAIDKSSDAIHIATQNAQLNGVAIKLQTTDFFELQPAGQKFDIIVSNPPYIAEADWPTLQVEVKQFEPSLALLAGKDGLDFYRKMIPQLNSIITPAGAVFLEVGYKQSAAVAAILEQQNFNTTIYQDYAKVNRVVRGILNRS
jgi:release factor glutamine methyltransferase